MRRLSIVLFSLVLVFLFINLQINPSFANPDVFGNQTVEPASVGWAAWWAFQYNVATAGTINSITADFSVYNSGKHVHIGVYTDTGASYPNSLIVETGQWDPGNTGWQTNDVADTPFSGGNLWIVVGCSDTVNLKIYGHLSTRDKCLKCVYKAGTYGTMPSTFPGGGTEYQDDSSIYVTYTPSGGQTYKVDLTQTVTTSLSKLTKSTFKNNPSLPVTVTETKLTKSTFNVRTGADYQYCLDFDGSDDYVEVTDASSIRDLTQWTITAWIYPRTIGEQNLGRILEKSSDFRINLETTTNIEALRGFTTDATAGSVGNPITLNTWNYITVTLNSSKYINIYVDAQQVSYGFHAQGAGSIDSDSGSNLIIGNDVFQDSSFDGYIDEYHFYNRVLTQAEINYEYSGGSGTNEPYSQSGLVAWWHFNEGSGATAYDETTNNNDGTLKPNYPSNSPQWITGKIPLPFISISMSDLLTSMLNVLLSLQSTFALLCIVVATRFLIVDLTMQITVAFAIAIMSIFKVISTLLPTLSLAKLLQATFSIVLGFQSSIAFLCFVIVTKVTIAIVDLTLIMTVNLTKLAKAIFNAISFLQTSISLTKLLQATFKIIIQSPIGVSIQTIINVIANISLFLSFNVSLILTILTGLLNLVALSLSVTISFILDLLHTIASAVSDLINLAIGLGGLGFVLALIALVFAVVGLPRKRNQYSTVPSSEGFGEEGSD